MPFYLARCQGADSLSPIWHLCLSHPFLKRCGVGSTFFTQHRNNCTLPEQMSHLTTESPHGLHEGSGHHTQLGKRTPCFSVPSQPSIHPPPLQRHSPYMAVLDCSLQELVHTLLHHVYIFYTHNTVYHSFHSLITQCKKNHFPLGWVVVFLTCLLDSLTWWVSNLASADTVNNTIKLFHTFKYSHILIFKCSTYSHIQMSKAFWNFTRSQFICFVLFPGL